MSYAGSLSLSTPLDCLAAGVLFLVGGLAAWLADDLVSMQERYTA